ncbi:hypothetical protein N4G69_21420 [Streptomyces mirabilis]|uniref:hypothetical protein n=1 Tax=Streptomyces mirabilis TaxID=68239 RepID=UPI0021C06FCF|nr:hypothetical protein [Streptomyces mirabilis]MCT9108164.1 hypothetical protein [Streptomyces mirabilis]
MLRPGLLQDRTAQTYSTESASTNVSMLRRLGLPAYPRVIPAGTYGTDDGARLAVEDFNSRSRDGRTVDVAL